MNAKSLLRQVQFVWIGLNERYLNIRTSDKAQYEEKPGWWRGPRTSAAQFDDNCAYHTPDYYYVYRIIRELDPVPDDVVYDIGAGKGRIVCVMSRRAVKKCVGIELFPDLADAARTNAARVRGRKAPIEVRCEDAATTNVSDGTVYFLFNPFGRETLQVMLANIELSLATNPRRIRIIYYNSVCSDIFDSTPWLRRYSAFKTMNGLDVAFYESRLQTPGQC